MSDHTNTANGLRYRLLLWWFRLGMKWTEYRCRRKGGDYYVRGKHRIVRRLGWF